MSDILDKIGKLLAQAEGTTNEAEQNAFTEKAQTLATTYAIDLEIARQRQRDKTKREVPVSEYIVLGQFGQKNLRHFVQLFLAVGAANDLEFLISTHHVYVDAFGFPSDIEVAQRLYASLVVQMQHAANDAIAAGEHKLPENRYFSERTFSYRTDARAFRTSFYEGFIAKVRARLLEAKRNAEAARAEVEVDENTTVSTALVLADKRKEVRSLYNERIKSQRIRGSWGGYSSGARVGGGYHAGSEAGARAHLGGRAEIGGSRRRIAS